MILLSGAFRRPNQVMPVIETALKPSRSAEPHRSTAVLALCVSLCEDSTLRLSVSLNDQLQIKLSPAETQYQRDIARVDWRGMGRAVLMVAHRWCLGVEGAREKAGKEETPERRPRGLSPLSTMMYRGALGTVMGSGARGRERSKEEAGAERRGGGVSSLDYLQ